MRRELAIEIRGHGVGFAGAEDGVNELGAFWVEHLGWALRRRRARGISSLSCLCFLRMVGEDSSISSARLHTVICPEAV